MRMRTCTGAKNGEPFAERCGNPAMWMCPSGPRCNECADRERAAIRDGACMLSICSDAKGGTEAEKRERREKIAAKYQRIAFDA